MSRSSTADNFFAHSTAASRYAAGRPYFHPLAIERIRHTCGIVDRLPRALDVACGTGMSSIALLELADTVVATDASIEMLAHTTADPRITYVHAPAEQLPDELGMFDLITVGMGFHWLNRPAFMSRVARLVRAGGWLAIYNNRFSATMRENPDFKQWSKSEYIRRFPTPPRDYTPMRADEARSAGFEQIRAIDFMHDVTFTPEQVVAYLLTQSNTIAAIENGTLSVSGVASQLLAGVRAAFGQRKTGSFIFHCDIQIYQRH